MAAEVPGADVDMREPARASCRRRRSEGSAVAASPPPAPTAGAILARAELEMRSQIESVAEGLRASPANVYNLVADLAADDIRGAANVDPQLLTEYLRNPVAYTSCVDAAPRLFAILTRPDGSVRDGGPCANLAPVVQEAPDNTAIQARFGSKHGFVIVLRQGGAEILQSFAGESGAKLVDSFAGGTECRTFSREELVGLLSRANVKGNQRQMFGGGVDTSEGGVWEMRPLAPDPEIQERMRAKLAEGLAALPTPSKKLKTRRRGAGERP